jgi:hypothetical protein
MLVSEEEWDFPYGNRETSGKVTASRRKTSPAASSMEKTNRALRQAAQPLAEPKPLVEFSMPPISTTRCGQARSSSELPNARKRKTVAGESRHSIVTFAILNLFKRRIFEYWRFFPGI